MRITIDIDTDHPDAYDHLRMDLEGLLSHSDEHGPAATWVQIRESVYEGTAARREWIGEGAGAEDTDPETCDPHAYPEGFDTVSDVHGRPI